MKEALFQTSEPVFYRSTQVQVTPTPHFHNGRITQQKRKKLQ
jgi:hypothetical protein